MLTESVELGFPDAWRSLNIARPHEGPGPFTGVLNEKCIAAPAWPDESERIHGCECVFVVETVAL
jgi:hypothetical protein